MPGHKEIHLEPTIEQLWAIIDLEEGDDCSISRAEGANHPIRAVFTEHPKGGRHLYVEDRNDPSRTLHIARDGNVIVCEGGS